MLQVYSVPAIYYSGAGTVALNLYNYEGLLRKASIAGRFVRGCVNFSIAFAARASGIYALRGTLKR